jgi:hypothetical protein
MLIKIRLGEQVPIQVEEDDHSDCDEPQSVQFRNERPGVVSRERRFSKRSDKSRMLIDCKPGREAFNSLAFCDLRVPCREPLASK